MSVSDTPPTGPEVRYHLGDLARLRQHVTDAARVAGLSPERVAHFTLAVNEVVTNAIRYARGSALVAISRVSDRLVVQVTDDGPGIPPSIAQRRPDPAPDAEGGRGLWLVRRCCDHVDIYTSNTGTRVRLIMLLAAGNGPAHPTAAPGPT